jgi:DNA-binding NtrC family response regulator
MRRILAVDDEPALLGLIERYLIRLGYAVDTCMTARQALELFAEDPSRYGVTLVDLHMPDMPGTDLILEMLRVKPDVRLLVCSGCPFDLQEIPMEARRQIGILQKPFMPAMLVREIERLLALGPP